MTYKLRLILSWICSQCIAWSNPTFNPEKLLKMMKKNVNTQQFSIWIFLLYSSILFFSTLNAIQI